MTRRGVLAPMVMTVAAVPFAAAGTYLGVLGLLARRKRPQPQPGLAATSGSAPVSRQSRLPRLVAVVPAHDEEAAIGDTVASLLAVDDPHGLPRVFVIADNCTDATAEKARSAGAEVLERFDSERRGKGYALADMLPRVLGDSTVDGVLLVDADTVVTPNVLRACAERLADGEHVCQTNYGVRNPNDSWRTRLMHVAFTCMHDVRSSARERMGLSVGLRGNGMVFSRHALETVPYEAFSIVEDVEHGIALARAGLRVAHVAEATVVGDMPATAAASRSQRDRWERGRAALRRSIGPALVKEAVCKRDLMLADLACDLFVPPLGQLAAGLTMLGVTAVVLSVAGSAPLVALVLVGVGSAGVIAYVLRGWQLSDTGVQGLADLARAPGYVAWKLFARIGEARRRASSADEWVRTERSSGLSGPMAEVGHVGTPRPSVSFTSMIHKESA